jgi:2'-5' RNA ligase
VFLGATDPADVPGIEAAIGGVVAGWPAFDVATGDGGGYLTGRGGVAWLQLDAGRDQAARLSRTLDGALEARNYEARAPKPHVTLARRVSRQVLDDVHRLDGDLRTRWRVEEVVLYRSHTSPASAEYEALRSFGLQGMLQMGAQD